MVGRLVEEQEVARFHQLPDEAEAPSFATTEHVHRGGLGGLRIEAEALQDRVDPGVGLIAPLMLEALEVVGVSLEDLRGAGVTQLGEAVALGFDRALELEQFGVRQRCRVPDVLGVREITVLVQERDPEPCTPQWAAGTLNDSFRVSWTSGSFLDRNPT